MNKKYLLAIVLILSFLALFIWQIQPRDNQLENDSQPHSAATISYLDILNNPEFRTGMQTAVLNHDDRLAGELQDKALEIANAAGLTKQQVDILSGDSGMRFMQFLAKRQLFTQEFEKRYLALQSIDELKNNYPEAADLFAKSDQLIQQRDENIASIAAQLNQGQVSDESLKLAKQMWLEKTRQNSPSNN